MKSNEVQKELKITRISHNIVSKEIAEAIQISASNITILEQKFLENSRIRYTLYLRKKGVDLNALFDKILQLTGETESQEK